MSNSEIEYNLTRDRGALAMVDRARGEDEEVAIPRTLAKVLQYYLDLASTCNPAERTKLHRGVEDAIELLAKSGGSNPVGRFTVLDIP